jgi:hypothetical protein
VALVQVNLGCRHGKPVEISSLWEYSLWVRVPPYAYLGDYMLAPIGKITRVTDPDMIARIRKYVETGTKLDTSKFNWTPKKSVQELLNQEKGGSI